jgi:hypothetical protein
MLQLRKEKGELHVLQLTPISLEMRQMYSNSGAKIAVKAQFHYPEGMR